MVFEDDRRGAVDVGVHVGVSGIQVLPHEELVLRLYRCFFFFRMFSREKERASLLFLSVASLARKNQ